MIVELEMDPRIAPYRTLTFVSVYTRKDAGARSSGRSGGSLSSHSFVRARQEPGRSKERIIKSLPDRALLPNLHPCIRLTVATSGLRRFDPIRIVGQSVALDPHSKHSGRTAVS